MECCEYDDLTKRTNIRLYCRLRRIREVIHRDPLFEEENTLTITADKILFDPANAAVVMWLDERKQLRGRCNKCGIEVSIVRDHGQLAAYPHEPQLTSGCHE